METNFFKQTTDLHLQGDLRITIKQQDPILIVSVLLKNDTCGDDARKVVPPILLKGTADEIDEGFFANIAAPLQTTSQLFVNMEAYLKAQETAQQQSKMEQQKISNTGSNRPKRKIYKLKKKKGQETLKITIDDLTPVPHKKSYSFEQLVNMISNNSYETDWTTEMEQEHNELYAKFGNCKYDFFKVRHSDLIVIPGLYLYVTSLTEAKINEMDSR